MEQAGNTALLIYPIGTSNLQYGGSGPGEAPIPRRIDPEHFAEVKARVIAHLVEPGGVAACLEHYGKAALPDGTPVPDGIIYVPPTGETCAITLPILAVILPWVAARYPGAEIRIWPIVTYQQTDEHPRGHPQDTIGVERLFRVYLRQLRDAGYPISAHVAEPGSVISCNAANHDEVAGPFAQLHRELESEIVRARYRYYTIGTGTPQMTFAAATTFGLDARLNVIYKPRVDKHEAERVEEVGRFRDLARQRTLDLLDRSLAGFDFALAERVLRGNDTGFPADHPHVAAALALLAVTGAWEKELFQDASAVPIPPSVAGQPWAVRRLAERLGRFPVEANARREFWRLKLVDAFVRLAIAAGRGDIAGFVERLQRFFEAALLCGLFWCDPTYDWHELPNRQTRPRALLDMRERYGWKREGVESALEGLRFLMWRVAWSDDVPPRRDQLRGWLRKLLLLHHVRRDELRRKGNAAKHSFTLLERDYLDNFTGTGDGLGAWVLLRLAHDVVAALPGGDTPANEMLQQVLGIPDLLAAAWPASRLVDAEPTPSAVLARDFAALLRGDPPDAKSYRKRVRAAYEERVERQRYRNVSGITEARKALRQSVVDVADQAPLRHLAETLRQLRDDIGHVELDEEALAQFALLGGFGQRWLEDRVLQAAAPSFLAPERQSDLAAWLDHNRPRAERAASLARLLEARYPAVTAAAVPAGGA